MDVRPALSASPSFDLKGRHGFVERRIRALAAKMRWGALLLIAAVGVGAYFGRDYIRIFMGGPKSVTVDELISRTDQELEKSPWVHVSGLQLKGVATKRRSRSQTVETTLAVHSGDADTTRSLFVLVGDSALPGEATGLISDMPSDFANRLSTTGDGAKLMRVARHSVTVETRWIEIYLLPGVLLAASIVALVLAAIQWRRSSRILNPTTSKPLSSLLRFGSLQETLPVINTDLGSGSVVKLGGATLGTDHIAFQTGPDLHILRISKLVWAYIEITKHSYNGIPTGKTYKAVLSDEYGYQASISLSKAKSEKLIELLQARNSSILATYTDELAAFWKANPQGTATAIKNRNQTK